jgi:hypothetical protein
MLVAELYVNDEDVLVLIGTLRDAGADAIAERFRDAYHRDARSLSVSASERRTILGALRDCPASLAELRATLAGER